ncbi:hypothetical protein [Mesorhizobium sp.]|uniref:hypothetical protein n=1 Tax=Mesorhizobium sp. TaxID=1871066 RepID=UPI000FEA19B7|nr:hypothetical protein [Mesorhizobium sp.]RWN54143.1 MAG: hypothetical protein EOS00_29090 [Mesorhizobium sp.]
MIWQEWKPTRHAHKARLRHAMPLSDAVAKASEILKDGYLRVLCGGIVLAEDGCTVVLEVRHRVGDFGDFELSATGATFAECIQKLQDPQVLVDAVRRQRDLESQVLEMQMNAPEPGQCET